MSESENDGERAAVSAPEDSEGEGWMDCSLSEPMSDEEELLDDCLQNSVEGDQDKVMNAVTSIITADSCDAMCCRGKEVALRECLLSLNRMDKAGRRVSLLTALAVLKEADIAERHRGYGLRDRYAYVLPMVGRVCRQIFCLSYNVSPETIKRLRAQIKGGDFAPRAHRGLANKNASAIDIDWLVDWFKGLAQVVAEIVPVHMRRQTTVDGMVRRYYCPVDFSFLPAYLTWAKLHQEMLNVVAEQELHIRTPALSTMRLLLKKHCPTIRIRSPRSNVCDVCSIYRNRMTSSAPADFTEAFGKHTMAARRMRQEYQKDLENADDSHAVVIIDYSQNLTLPSVTTTPSQWYFLSLWTVNMFGVYFANDAIQFNYIYEESTAGKGSDEVNSLLHHFVNTILLPRGYSKLTVYADNCTGQNKNNYVVKFLLALTHMADFEDVSQKIFVKGHTKNAVDRGFGHVRKKVARSDIYTMDQLLATISGAATSSATVHITTETNAFRSYKPVLEDVYRNVPAISKYQVFSMSERTPGTVRCFVDPDDEPVVCDLRRQYEGVVTEGIRVQTMFECHLNTLPRPAPKPEKLVTMHTKFRPYVPAAFQNDPLYSAPTDVQVETAKAIKKARSGARKVTAPARPKTETRQRNSAIDEAMRAGNDEVNSTPEPPKRHCESEEKINAPSKQRARKET